MSWATSEIDEIAVAVTSVETRGVGSAHDSYLPDHPIRPRPARSLDRQAMRFAVFRLTRKGIDGINSSDSLEIADILRVNALHPVV
jgi:hypothetical protein